MKKVISSLLLPKTIIDRLSELGVQCIQGYKNPHIANETAFHPDMMFYKMLSGQLLTSNVIPVVHNLDTFVNLKFSKFAPKDKYPDDCIFNCFSAKNCLICGVSTAEEIIEDAEDAGLQIMRVKQGYCACSTIKLNDEAFISSDVGIVKALTTTGHDVLFVENEGISLNGYNNGFIGGCSIQVENAIAFTGAIEKHKNYKDIKIFSNNHGLDVISLSSDNLYDYGGFIAL